MTRNHFSKKGGPYFVNDGFPKYSKPIVPTTRVSLIGKIRSLFKFPRSKPAK